MGPSTRPPLAVLIQGGIASGKSTISRLLVARGARALDCDRIAHEVLETPEVEAEVRAAFGPAVFGDDGHVQRKALGEVVFEDPAALARLEQLVHPRVRERVQQALTSMRAAEGEPRQVAVIDAAVASKMRLLEGDADYDVVLFVEVSPETRRRRAAERGWAPGELERREARQESLAVLRDRADVVIPNDGDLREAERHVERVWSEFVEPRR